MKETFEDYLQKLKDRRTEDDYKYTDEDFKNRIHYIFDCYEKDLSVYKCLEFMYFAEREIQPEQIWNDEKMEGVKKLIQEQKLIIKIIKSDEELGLYEAFKNIPEPNDKLKKAFRDFGKKETLEQIVSKQFQKDFNDEVGNVLVQELKKKETKPSAVEWLYKNLLENPISNQDVEYNEAVLENAKEMEKRQHDFLPGLIKQFDPKEGEMNGEQWTAVHFLKWLELNKFKIIK